MGAEIDLWEPDAEQLRGKPLVPPGLDFAGRPQLIGRVRGGGRRQVAAPQRAHRRGLRRAGRAVDEPAVPRRGARRPAVRPRRVRHEGRDRRDGVRDRGARGARRELAGDLLVATNTDEESSGAGGTAIVERGIRADAGIVTEATGFDTWISCRGSEYGVIRVPGRPGHAEVQQPGWQAGGAVNAIEKATVVIDAIRSLREEWARPRRASTTRGSRGRRCCRRWCRQASGRSPIRPSCELTIAVMYLPVQADGRGFGADIRREVEGWIRRETGARRLAGRASAGVRVVAERRDAARDPRGRADRRRDAAGDRRRRPARLTRRPRLLVRRRHASRSSAGSRRSASGRRASTPTG